MIEHETRRTSTASVVEAIALSEQIVGQKLTWIYADENRIGDHIWWISSNASFKSHYPAWSLTYDIPRILREIYEENRDRWVPGSLDRLRALPAEREVTTS